MRQSDDMAEPTSTRPSPRPSPRGRGRQISSPLSLWERVRVRADEGSNPQPHRPIDWRGWIIVAWVVWFGLLYGKMVVEQRGGKLSAWLRGGGPSRAASR
jgi:hypothetical protein